MQRNPCPCGFYPEPQLEETHIDDSYTGTNFERPEMKLMMADADAGKIACILVKDLSRFGRERIETGTYIEKTEESITPDCTFHRDGNRIRAKTLDLNTDFRVIARQPYAIAREYFGAVVPACYRGFIGVIEREKVINSFI